MIPIILHLSDVAITSFPRDYDWLTRLPLKVIEALGAGRPVITTPLLEHKRTLPSEYLINYDELTPIDLRDRIKAIMCDGVQGNISINVEEFSWDFIAEGLYRRIEEQEVRSSY